MAHEDLGVLVRASLGNKVLEFVLQKHVARQRDDATELVFAGSAGEQGHRAALGEAADDDALGGDTGSDFGVDESVHSGARAQNASLVLLGGEVVNGFLRMVSQQSSL